MYNEEIASLINKYNLIENNDRLVVGVSGGPDSMFLLFYLISIKGKYNLNIYVAHVNHHTRGNENLYEQNLIEKYCIENNIPYYVDHFIKNSKDNFHEEARNFRYDFFIRLAKELNVNKIALAHHRDDQVETILFKIIRGNNINGYLGMKPIYDIDNKISIIRPLLNITKDYILNVCNECNIPYAIDSSNIKNKYTRNNIRNKIIPLFKELQPDFNNKICQFQEQLSEVSDFLEQNMKNIYQEMIISSEKDRIILDINILKNTHISLIRLILVNVISKLSNNKLELTYEKIKNVINIINNDKPNITFDLGKSYYCIKEYEKIIFQKDLKETKEYQIIVDDFKDYFLPNGMKISVKKVEEKAKMHNKLLFLCYNSTIWPLVIRTRKDGDFINTKIGKKKVNRVFIDAKIPANLRKSWPLLVDKNDNVLWVVGIKKSELNLLISNEYILVEVL